mmetsp:Transcript_1929/g.4015  ORF Transcript_1929/g.4015 Transcript_1929/m.4015 type:complete len:267 (+) Transcript_1929:712-1512(+)
MLGIIIIPPMPSRPTLIPLIKKIRHLLPRLVRRRLRNRHHILLIPSHTPLLRHILSLIPILRMCRIKCHIQKEGLVPGPRHQKAQRIRLVLLGDMPRFSANLAIVPSVLLDVEVNVLIEGKVHAPFAGVSDVISVPCEDFVKAQFVPIFGGAFQLLFGFFAAGPAARFGGFVAGHVLSGVEGGAADPADGGGDAVVGEADAVGGEGVEDGGLEDGVDGVDVVVGGEGVVGPVVGVEEEDVHSGEISFGVGWQWLLLLLLLLLFGCL